MDYQIIVDVNRLNAMDMIFILSNDLDDRARLLGTITILSKWLFDKEANEYLPREVSMSYLLDCSIEKITEYLEEMRRLEEVCALVSKLIK